MRTDKEATTREVLAEVNMLDLWAATKTLLSQWGCLIGFILFSTLIGSATTIVTGSKHGFGFPDWALWLFVIWMALGTYTEGKSYHEHKVALYFPKFGWIWSLPLAGYILIGIHLYRAGDPGDDYAAKALHVAALIGWWFPFFLALAILEIGHGRVMEKRASADNTA